MHCCVTIDIHKINKNNGLAVQKIQVTWLTKPVEKSYNLIKCTNKKYTKISNHFNLFDDGVFKFKYKLSII